jgi:NAD(P)H-dependent flavin oxidoreductase YrpB (nitropropane dioxygenase family)
VQLVANALGTPPADVLDEIHRSGRLVAALSGSVQHARRHREAGVDIVIAQGHEGGGHTGEVGSVVLWPEVVDAVTPTPVLAAGGVASGGQIAAALAAGAEGVWTGSVWLTTRESDCPAPQVESYLAAGSGDTVRSRSFSGKPARMLRTAWTEAWERPDSPDPLPLPLQGMVAMEAMARFYRYPERSQAVGVHPVGQVVGQLREVRSCREVIDRMVDEFFDAVEHLRSLQPAAD